MQPTNGVARSTPALSLDDRCAMLEAANAELRERLQRVEFVLRQLGVAAAFIDEG